MTTEESNRINGSSTRFTIVARGRYSLAESGMFGRTTSTTDWPGSGRYDPGEGVLRLGFLLDDLATPVGVALTQDDAGVHGRVSGLDPGGDVTAVRVQVARMLSLDVDAAGFEAVGERDPQVARLLAAAPGLWPLLFHSPYEAALWCVISQRWGARQATAARERLSREFGTVMDVDGRETVVVPTPAQLLAAERYPGLPETKQQRLRAVAQAASDGLFAVAAIRDGDPAEVRARLRRVNGIGEFAASLIHLRSSGVTDALVDGEPRLATLVGALYGLGGPASREDLTRIAEAWRPFRTWVAVLVRAAGRRLPELADLPEPAPAPAARSARRATPGVTSLDPPRAHLALIG
ncbi:MAG: DNA-3-methyladenine glycosylase 2 family protein [Pseudonocardia sp.]|nr:DNA-3-methyladenine glycosylase 2 family protein [Pseudonocardia sp.]